MNTELGTNSPCTQLGTSKSLRLNVIGPARETETYRVQPHNHVLEHLSRKFRHRVPLTRALTLTPAV